MKLYLKTRNKFLVLSIIFLICSALTIFVIKNESLGYFLLGTCISTIIITIQSSMAAKVEESRLLIEKLRKMYDLCFGFDKFYSFSVEIFDVDFEEEFYIYKNKLAELFNINHEVASISNLKETTKQKLDEITNKITDLQLDLHFIFKKFDELSGKYRIIYFMEFYKIIHNFNIEELQNQICELGWAIDSNEFFNDDYNKKLKRRIKNLEYSTSIEIYNKKIEKNNEIEYKSLKHNFEIGMKTKRKVNNNK